MALARLALKNLQRRVSSPSSSSILSFDHNHFVTSQRQTWASQFLRKLSTTAGDDCKPSEGREVAVSEGAKKSKLFPKRNRKRSLWRNNNNNHHLFPSLHGLGNALLQASENLNRVFENLTPNRLLGRVKEQDECYKLRFDLPGVAKEDVKITVEDGILRIRGEQKQEEEEGSEEYWSSRSYGYYDTSLVLPEDAKAEEVKAEMRDGVLNITIPRSETQKKDVKEVEIY